MRKNLTEMVFILDRSGSMGGREDDTIGGFNSLIEKQRAVEGDAYVSVVLFDDVSEVLYDRVDLSKIEPMGRKQYYVRGCTALLDALGDAVEHIGRVHRYTRDEDVPEKTIFVITTDGLENASRRHSLREVRREVLRRQEEYGWEFIYLGANIDAIASAADIGIRRDHAANYRCDSEGIGNCYSAMSDVLCSMRCDIPIRESRWKDRLEPDGPDGDGGEDGGPDNT